MLFSKPRGPKDPGVGEMESKFFLDILMLNGYNCLERRVCENVLFSRVAFLYSVAIFAL